MSFAACFARPGQIPPSRNYATRDKVCKLCMMMGGSGREAEGCGRVSFAVCFGRSIQIPPSRNYATRDKSANSAWCQREGSWMEGAGGCRLRLVSGGQARTFTEKVRTLDKVCKLCMMGGALFPRLGRKLFLKQFNKKYKSSTPYTQRDCVVHSSWSCCAALKRRCQAVSPPRMDCVVGAVWGTCLHVVRA